MAGYSGTTEFDFEIERYKDKQTGNYIAYLLEEDEERYEYTTLTLKVEGRSYFQPGKLYGPPENCYPDEGEVEITAVIGPDGKDWEGQLTHSEHDYIEEMIDEKVRDGLDGPDPDDYFDNYE
jgi:hypothetical protein